MNLTNNTRSTQLNGSCALTLSSWLGWLGWSAAHCCEGGQQSPLPVEIVHCRKDVQYVLICKLVHREFLHASHTLIYCRNGFDYESLFRMQMQYMHYATSNTHTHLQWLNTQFAFKRDAHTRKEWKLKGNGERGHLPLVVSSQLAPYLQNNPIKLVVLYMHTQQGRGKVRILTPRMLAPTNTS